MHYVSTRGGAASQSFLQILLEGLAPDGGLYMPESYPQFTSEELHRMRSYGYRETALAVLSLFATDIPNINLRWMLDRVYTKENFGTDEITPLTWLEDGKVALLGLSNGPTLAFKDVPLQFVGRLMDYALELKFGSLNILGATSGDTGSAAEYALKGVHRARVFMLSPKGRMSVFQQRQMYTLDAPNIHNIVVDGTFDDCQAMVKEVNADAAFKTIHNIGAVNSINLARLLAQMVYWVYAYCHTTTREGEEICVAVSSGNFGNAESADMVRRMGVPIRRIIIATNENDVLDEFFRKGIYRVRSGSDVRKTSSPSMDIAAASNLERYVFDIVHRDTDLMRHLWSALANHGYFDLRSYHIPYQNYMRSGSATEPEVLKTIRSVYWAHDVIIDPHTAVGLKVGLQERDPDIPLIVAETAQPAKFADTIYQALGIYPPVPEAFSQLAELPEHVTFIGRDVVELKQFIAEHV